MNGIQYSIQKLSSFRTADRSQKLILKDLLIFWLLFPTSLDLPNFGGMFQSAEKSAQLYPAEFSATPADNYAPLFNRRKIQLIKIDQSNSGYIFLGLLNFEEASTLHVHSKSISDYKQGNYPLTVFKTDAVINHSSLDTFQSH